MKERSYRLGGLALDLVRSDVLGVPGDALLFGRTPELRSRLESRAGCGFVPLADQALEQAWPCALMRSELLPWSTTLSISYRPRARDPFAAMTLANLPHVTRLARALEIALCWLRGRWGARRIVLVPVSWRNTQVVACATVSALSMLGTGVSDDTRVTIVAEKNLAPFHEWLDDETLLARANEVAGVPLGARAQAL